MSIAADFPTIEKYKNNFGFTVFGRGAATTDTESSFSGVDLSGVKGGIFLIVNDSFTAGVAEQQAIPAPFAASLDIVVSASETGTESNFSTGQSGDVTVEVAIKKFIGPSTTDDRGTFYNALMREAYGKFLDGSGDIGDTRDFTKQSDFTDNSDFSQFSDSFSSLDGLPK